MTSHLSRLLSILGGNGTPFTTPKTCRATLASCKRGTSTWPRDPRLRRSRFQSSGSACKSITRSCWCSAAASGLAAYGGLIRTRLIQRSAREAHPASSTVGITVAIILVSRDTSIAIFARPGPVSASTRNQMVGQGQRCRGQSMAGPTGS